MFGAFLLGFLGGALQWCGGLAFLFLVLRGDYYVAPAAGVLCVLGAYLRYISRHTVKVADADRPRG